MLSPNGRIHNLTTEDWERAFRVNVLGAVNGIRAAVAVMRAQKSGSIILTASVSGLTAWSHAAPYCATKAAVIQLAGATLQLVVMVVCGFFRNSSLTTMAMFNLR